MRTEQEIKHRIAVLEDFMAIAIKKYYMEEYTEEEFANVYSDIWDEMKHLYWVLGQSSLEASKHIAPKVMRLSDEIKAALNKQ